MKMKKTKYLNCERIIKQFHYTSWPDHDVPYDPLPVISFIRKCSLAKPRFNYVNSQGETNINGAGCVGEPNFGTISCQSAINSTTMHPDGGGPIVVHCSAGVGRTGTYIVIDAMLQQMQMSRKLNVYGFLKHIRTQRNYLVQTEEQYVFTYDVLLEALKSGETEIHRDKFSAYVYELMFPPSKTQFGIEINIPDGPEQEKNLVTS